MAKAFRVKGTSWIWAPNIGVVEKIRVLVQLCRRAPSLGRVSETARLFLKEHAEVHQRIDGPFGNSLADSHCCCRENPSGRGRAGSGRKDRLRTPPLLLNGYKRPGLRGGVADRRYYGNISIRCTCRNDHIELIQAGHHQISRGDLRRRASDGYGDAG